MLKLVEDTKSLMCPWLKAPFNNPNGYELDGYGQVLGYNYLGGHLDTPWVSIGMANAEWLSPQKTSDKCDMILLTDLNAWSSEYEGGKTFAPHGPRGAILESYDSGNTGTGVPSAEIGAAGGNIGILDGSGYWKKIDEMKIHVGSNINMTGACFTAW